ncbi:MAG: hypothetical protein EZS28_011328 [Streblomastix strix]|uniref:Uncharacterized protein n=1 Tax=Streblomastix strix TaxID=222440 RepID=A0A5J4WFF2_9EUKA|nr:MAG: hypothetical protein EZS28_011328 [Streblomastix strix]
MWLDSPVARQETKNQQELHIEPQNSQMKEKSDEIGGRLMSIREAWTAIRAERQMMMGIMPLQINKNSKRILKNISYPTQSGGNIFQSYHRAPFTPTISGILSRGSFICLYRLVIWAQVFLRCLNQNPLDGVGSYQKQSNFYNTSIFRRYLNNKSKSI